MEEAEHSMTSRAQHGQRAHLELVAQEQVFEGHLQVDNNVVALGRLLLLLLHAKPKPKVAEEPARRVGNRGWVGNRCAVGNRGRGATRSAGLQATPKPHPLLAANHTPMASRPCAANQQIVGSSSTHCEKMSLGLPPPPPPPPICFSPSSPYRSYTLRFSGSVSTSYAAGSRRAGSGVGCVAARKLQAEKPQVSTAELQQACAGC